MCLIWLRVMTWNWRPCTFLVISKQRRPGTLRLRHGVQVNQVKWARQETWTPDKHNYTVKKHESEGDSKQNGGGSSFWMTFISICTTQCTEWMFVFLWCLHDTNQYYFISVGKLRHGHRSLHCTPWHNIIFKPCTNINNKKITCYAELQIWIWLEQNPCNNSVVSYITIRPP